MRRLLAAVKLWLMPAVVCAVVGLCVVLLILLTAQQSRIDAADRTDRQQSQRILKLEQQLAHPEPPAGSLTLTGPSGTVYTCTLINPSALAPVYTCSTDKE